VLPSVFAWLGDNLYVVRDRNRVLELAPALQELARRTGQPGAMHWLEYFLCAPSLASKPPYLVLQLEDVPKPGQLHGLHITAAALFFEYRFAGIRTGVFSTDDAVGFRTVIAAVEERACFAERAACALLNNGAHVVLTTYERPEETTSMAEPLPGALIGYRQRSVGRMLTLGPTYEQTLARLGRLTRRNLRYYRRHLESRMQLEFIADARRDLSFEQFERLNEGSLNPVRNRKELWLRWRCSSETDGGYVAGLRSAEGEWLSLLGGWRDGDTTVVHWQLNSSGFEQHSIGIVIRSFFLEHEIERGARKLLMFGGTPHSIRHAFDEDLIADLVLCRPTLQVSALRALARQLVQSSAQKPKNHLLQVLAAVRLTALTPRLSRSSSLKRPSARTHEAG
jgi:hypothetical protein